MEEEEAKQDLEASFSDPLFQAGNNFSIVIAKAFWVED